jgi:hypothetical protein
MYTEIDACRISGSRNLIEVLSLGEQCLTGVFPKSTNEAVTRGPLQLVWCPESGLLQLKQSYGVDEMYGSNYGYRSGLNASMVRHLRNKARMLERLAALSSDDCIVDIGSNDGTLLNAYPSHYRKIGVDPTGKKFAAFYSEGTTLIPEFFTADAVRSKGKVRSARLITSIAMFYDLEKPRSFVADVADLLAENGLWHFEQSYMLSMLRTNSYDTICHEHLEFYSFTVVKDLLESCGLRVVTVETNAVNGGSFAVTACREKAVFKSNVPVIEWMLRQEQDMHLDTPKPYRDFEERVYLHRKNLVDLLGALTDDGKTIIGYGASTKGNVLLQFCGLTTSQIPYMAEVNEDKFGCFTPGTNIPIISESAAREMKPDYFLVLPWHFKHSILEREAEFLALGGKMIFPLPEIEII